MLNKGLLSVDRSKLGDDRFTPFYAVKPIMKYIPKDKKIWMPFDQFWSAYYRLFTENGYDVVISSIETGQDFFNYEPNEDYDIIVSNPPFSEKDKVLKRLYELNKPFAMLLPLSTLQGDKRSQLFYNNNIQLLCFDKRICFHDKNNLNKTIKGIPFATGYFCKDILPNNLIVEELIRDEEPLM